MSMDNFGQFCWNELATGNVKTAKEFYHAVFGWEFKEHKTADKIYTFINIKDQGIGGIWEIPKSEESKIPPHWMSYILVESAKETLTKAVHHGAKEVMPVTEVEGMGCFAIIMDPTGAHIAFWETKS